MEWKLLRAAHGDAEELSIFAARSFRETYDGQMSKTDLEAYIAEAFNSAVQVADIADPETTIVLARDEAGPGCPLVGYVQLVAREGFVELKRLYVDLPYKGGGLAVRLLQETLNECRRIGSERLRLTVWTQNPRAIAFYRKMGFGVTGSETFMVGEDAQIDHVMEMNVLPVPTSS